MLEFIFFHKKTCELFEKAAKSSEIITETVCNDDTFLVRLGEDIDEEVLDNLEDYYDELMNMDQALMEETADSSDTLHAAGITIQLNDGRNVYASIDPALLSRVLQCISPDELNTLVHAITEAVENPDTRSLCQRRDTT